MEAVKSKTTDFQRSTETQQTSSDKTQEKLQSTKKLTYTFSTQPLETDLKNLLLLYRTVDGAGYARFLLVTATPMSQVTGRTDLPGITEVKLKVVSGQAGLHRLSDYTPYLRMLILDGSCISSFRDLGSGLKSLTTLSVARCSMKHLDGVWGFGNLEDLNARENFVSDPSPCSGVRKLSKLDLSKNQIADVSYFAFLRSCRKLEKLYVTENHFSNYKEEIRAYLPQLRILDDEEFQDRGLQLKVTDNEGEDQSSEEGSSTSLLVEDIDLEQTQTICYEIDTEDDGENIPWKQDDRKMENEEEIDEEKENEDEETSEYPVYFSSLREDRTNIVATRVADSSLDDVRIQLPSNDSDASSNSDKSIAHEIPPGKLSSGRVICGNLAASLRARNPTK